MIVVKTFEAEAQSSSNLGVNWNVDTDSLIVCRGTEQEIPAKITQRIVLSIVSAVFDPIGIYIRKRFILKSIWAAMEEAWDKELSAEHSKLFSAWCSELKEIRTMSLNRHYFENGCSNLTLHIFTDASEEAMCIVTYLQDEATLRFTYVIEKCRVAPIRHMTIPKLELQVVVYGVHLRKQILSEHDVRIEKNLSLDQLINSATVAASSTQETTSVRCEQRRGNFGKRIDESMETRQRCPKPSRHRNPRNVHQRPQRVRMAKRAGMAPGR